MTTNKPTFADLCEQYRQASLKHAYAKTDDERKNNEMVLRQIANELNDILLATGRYNAAIMQDAKTNKYI